MMGWLDLCNSSSSIQNNNSSYQVDDVSKCNLKRIKMKTPNSRQREQNITNKGSHPKNDKIRNQKNRDKNYENILSQLEDTRHESHYTINRQRVYHILNKALQFETDRYY
jgi:hypothetical protein